MKKILLLTCFLAVRFCVAQDIVFRPMVSWKEAPASAIALLKAQKLKAKKARWSVADNGVYFAVFQKKNKEQFAYYFHSDGSFLYKRYPVAAADMPSALRDHLGPRLTVEGTWLYSFSGLYFPVYLVRIPTRNGYADEYFTADGESYDMKFK